MPDRAFATRELATLLGVLAHPERIRIVEELRDGELDVASLQRLLGVAHSRVSQNLGILRSHRIVAERREGRHVFYRLVQPVLAGWLLEGMKFLERGADLSDELRVALARARERWSQPVKPLTPPVESSTTGNAELMHSAQAAGAESQACSSPETSGSSEESFGGKPGSPDEVH